jgi:Zn-dependent peptidase ImmA (M78 family)
MGSSAPAAPPWTVGERAAQALRFEMGLGHGPIDIYDVVSRRGVSVVFRDLEGDDGRYVFHNGQALMIVTTACGEATRQRFTAAHELGHHELHRFSGDSETPTYLVDHNIFAKGERRETEANAFAATLLLPTEALRAEFPGRPKVELEDVVTLMQRYRVSLEVTVNRLNNAKIISAARRQALLDEGWGRVRELRGEEQPRKDQAIPAALEESLRRLYLAGLVGPERLSAALGLADEEVVGRYGHPQPPQADVDDLIAELDGDPESEQD